MSSIAVYLSTFQILFLRLNFLKKVQLDVEMTVGHAGKEVIGIQGGNQQSSSMVLHSGQLCPINVFSVLEVHACRLLVTQSCQYRGRWAVMQKGSGQCQRTGNWAEFYRSK